MTRFWILIATGFGAGYAPVASGTFGTLVGIPIVLLTTGYGGTRALLTWALIIFFLGWRAAAVAESWFERSDPGQIVIDEVVGFMVTMAFIPVSFTTLAVGFFVFRFFDVAKLWPARYFDDRPGPLAVMLDDVCAGVYSNLAMHLLVLVGALGGAA